jgi:hypothetical protein
LVSHMPKTALKKPHTPATTPSFRGSRRRPSPLERVGYDGYPHCARLYLGSSGVVNGQDVETP